MGLFKFETKKNWRRKKFIILSLLVLVCVVGLFSRNVFMQDEIGENATLTITAPYFEDANDLQNALREEKQENPDDQQLSAQYDNVLEMNALLYDLSNAIEKEQWNRVPELESKFLNTVVIHLESGGSFNSFKREELQQKAKKNAILLEHQLPYEDGNYSLTTANFMKIAATILISLLGVLILLFILGDQLSEEFENHTIRTLYTQPLKIVKLLFGKYASMMVGTLFVLFIFIIACLITSLAFGRGFGSLAYPQLVLFDDGFTYITITEYLSKLFTLFIGTASFAFSLVLLFSNLFKNRFSTFLITLLALSLGSLLTNQGEILQTPWNPFYYFRFTELIEYPDTLGNFSYVFILFAYSLIVLYICYMVQKKGFSFHLEALYIGPFGKGKTMKSPNRLFAISLFEWRKIWRQGYLKQMIVVLLLLAVGGYLFFSFHFKRTKQNRTSFKRRRKTLNIVNKKLFLGMKKN